MSNCEFCQYEETICCDSFEIRMNKLRQIEIYDRYFILTTFLINYYPFCGRKLEVKE